jgi:CRISPR-associated protein Cas2
MAQIKILTSRRFDPGPRHIMPRATTYLICYDLSSDAERGRVASLLEGYGFRLQFSVFECRLARATLDRLLRDIEKLDVQSGTILITRLDERARRYAFGRSLVPNPMWDKEHHALTL